LISRKDAGSGGGYSISARKVTGLARHPPYRGNSWLPSHDLSKSISSIAYTSPNLDANQIRVPLFATKRKAAMSHHAAKSTAEQVTGAP
jgi:hypothetical protein